MPDDKKNGEINHFLALSARFWHSTCQVCLIQYKNQATLFAILLKVNTSIHF